MKLSRLKTMSLYLTKRGLKSSNSNFGFPGDPRLLMEVDFA